MGDSGACTLTSHPGISLELGSGKQTGIDHECMGAGEDAVELLVEHGLIAPSGRGGTWTEAGKALLAEG